MSMKSYPGYTLLQHFALVHFLSEGFNVLKQQACSMTKDTVSSKRWLTKALHPSEPSVSL